MLMGEDDLNCSYTLLTDFSRLCRFSVVIPTPLILGGQVTEIIGDYSSTSILKTRYYFTLRAFNSSDTKTKPKRSIKFEMFSKVAVIE